MIIALAILLLVLAVWYNFNSYVNQSFTISSQQSAVQFNVRMAKEQVENLVRFADHMKILEEYDPNEINETFTEAIYIDENDALIHYRDGFANNMLEGISDDIIHEIYFNIGDQVSEPVFLWYNINGTTTGGYSYELSAEIQILSVQVATGIIKDFGAQSDTGKAIIFGFE